MDLNSWNGTGRLTRDPQLKNINDTYLCTFSIAVDGYKENVHFFDVECWGQYAEVVSTHINKGARVAVSGELIQSRWEQDGQKRSKVKIRASEVTFLSAPGESTRAEEPDDEVEDIQELDDSDVPF